MASAARMLVGESSVTETGMSLALASALTPDGVVSSPSFFHGFAVYPRALAQGLITLSDITASRYYQFTPTNRRDPVLTAHGDRLRAEVFSADNTVYARLDIDGRGLDGADIGFGTTNVDIGQGMRQKLAQIKDIDLFHLDVGEEGMVASTRESTVVERPVEMPGRWVRAFGNASELHRELVPRFLLNAAQARSFIATLPPLTGSSSSVWLTPTPTGVRISPRPTKDSVWVDGLNRLTALKRLLTLQTGLTFYGPADGSERGMAVEVRLPGATLFLALTETLTRGYSGEGSLLEALVSPLVLDDAALVNAALSFEPIIDVPRLSVATAVDEERVQDALAALATSGRVGWDSVEGAYFHRELPDDPDRIEKDNPRLVRARNIADDPASISKVEGESAWLVDGGNGIHRVSESGDSMTCTCTWSLKYRGTRGPCAHALAVMTRTGRRPAHGDAAGE